MHMATLNLGPAAPLPVTMLALGVALATLLPLPEPVELGEPVAKVRMALLAAGAE